MVNVSTDCIVGNFAKWIMTTMWKECEEVMELMEVTWGFKNGNKKDFYYDNRYIRRRSSYPTVWNFKDLFFPDLKAYSAAIEPIMKIFKS